MNDIERLKDVIDDIDNLIDAKVDSSSNSFKIWKTKAERVVINIFGENSFEHKKFKSTLFCLCAFTFSTPDEEFVKACKEDLEMTKGIFLSYLEELENNNRESFDEKKYDSIFIVHGHDGELKLEVDKLIKGQGIEAVVLSDQVNGGRTIIEKFVEESSRCSAAIILMTADDEAKEKESNEYKYRARQNVIFEAGYFIGMIGRNRVIIIVEKGVDIPSDLQGVVYTSKTDWKLEVLKELKRIGFSIDANKLL